ncbi:jg26311 [Pararge aegeria aegeria]|uniref:Jg26311 protein n=1 Tax=Pararge aegeria aegeria TaxID=348720 RepID=A0A8S4QR94_9NEOP|nr:jg26311 [Pararge aegeria aegeria]
MYKIIIHVASGRTENTNTSDLVTLTSLARAAVAAAVRRRSNGSPFSSTLWKGRYFDKEEWFLLLCRFVYLLVRRLGGPVGTRGCADTVVRDSTVPHCPDANISET